MTRINAAAWLLSLLLIVAVIGAGSPPLAAQTDRESTEATAIVEVPTAPVVIDGRVLFRVRGVASFPAETRARGIRDRIVELAADPAFRPESLRVAPEKTYTALMAGERRVLAVLDADAQLEGVTRAELAEAALTRTQMAIEDYRQARESRTLVKAALYVLAATVALAAALFAFAWLVRRLDAAIASSAATRLRAVEVHSYSLVTTDAVVGSLRSALAGIRIVVVLILAVAYLSFALRRFPWTRGVASDALHLLTGPLQVIALAAVRQIPNLIFLCVVVFVVRLVLRLLRLFFDSVARGRVHLRSFEREWANPTYKIVRLLIVAFAVVVSYPYVPGSDTAAFKGMSVFVGLVFSLGSSSIIANSIAGYALTYRRAFRVGDRVQLAGVTGDVLEIRPQVTRLRSLKNEEVIVPNSVILSSQVVNYSSLAAQHGLLLHTTVGIGYETPWRQVEAMLLLAAERTAGVTPDPPPFVLHTALGNFAVEYELNVACADARQMLPLYTELHRNILDVFNEYGVQIMTPAYEGDPTAPKVVARDQWHAAPAGKPDPGHPPGRSSA